MDGQSSKEGQKNTGRDRQKKPHLCLSVSNMQDSDLDCAPPLGRHRNMPQEMAGPQPGAPPPYNTDLQSSTGLPPSPVPIIYPDTPDLRRLLKGETTKKSQRGDPASPTHIRSGLVFRKSPNPFISLSPVRSDTGGNAHKVLNLPVMDLAGADGHPILVHRPWAMEDIKQTLNAPPITIRWRCGICC